MSNKGKIITLTLILTIVMSSAALIMVKPANAQIPKPSAPEFTVKQVDRSYDVPVTYVNSTDPYTGKQVTVKNGGYHVTNRTVDVTIKNQPFTLKNPDGTTNHLYYTVRWKGHFENWTDQNTFSQASTSDYTVMTYILGYSKDWDIPDGGQVDLQVQATVGYYQVVFDGHIAPGGTEFVTVAESDWSSTQTITVSYTSSISPSVSPIPTPTVPELSWLTIFVLLLFTVSVTVIIGLKKQITFLRK